VRFAHGANNPPFRGRTAKGWATRLGGRWSRLAFLRGRGDRLEGFGAEAADAAVGAYGVGERECVPVLVGVGDFVQPGVGLEGAPVAAVVGGDVGAVGAYGDPGLSAVS
jgi:hypothetical protein